MIQEKKFTEWFENEKAKGLKDFHVSWNPSFKPQDREEAFKALNELVTAMENSETVRRPDVF